MSALPNEPLRFTEKEYLAFECASDNKHELIDSYVYAMAGASEEHNTICSNILASLHSQFRKRPCKVYGSDMRIRADASGNYFYPDISAICGEPIFADSDVDTITNPNLIIVVLSPSTEDKDKGLKTSRYRVMETLSEFLLVSQDKAHVEVYRRLAMNKWEITEYQGSETVIKLDSVDCSLALADVYEKVQLENKA